MTSIENKTKYINSVLKQNINTRRNTKETTSKNRLKLLKKLHNKKNIQHGNGPPQNADTVGQIKWYIDSQGIDGNPPIVPDNATETLPGVISRIIKKFFGKMDNLAVEKFYDNLKTRGVHTSADQHLSSAYTLLTDNDPDSRPNCGPMASMSEDYRIKCENYVKNKGRKAWEGLMRGLYKLPSYASESQDGLTFKKLIDSQHKFYKQYTEAQAQKAEAATALENAKKESLLQKEELETAKFMAEKTEKAKKEAERQVTKTKTELDLKVMELKEEKEKLKNSQDSNNRLTETLTQTRNNVTELNEIKTELEENILKLKAQVVELDREKKALIANVEELENKLVVANKRINELEAIKQKNEENIERLNKELGDAIKQINLLRVEYDKITATLKETTLYITNDLTVNINNINDTVAGIEQKVTDYEKQEKELKDKLSELVTNLIANSQNKTKSFKDKLTEIIGILTTQRDTYKTKTEESQSELEGKITQIVEDIHKKLSDKTINEKLVEIKTLVNRMLTTKLKEPDKLKYDSKIKIEAKKEDKLSGGTDPANNEASTSSLKQLDKSREYIEKIPQSNVPEGLKAAQKTLSTAIGTLSSTINKEIGLINGLTQQITGFFTHINELENKISTEQDTVNAALTKAEEDNIAVDPNKDLAVQFNKLDDKKDSLKQKIIDYIETLKEVLLRDLKTIIELITGLKTKIDTQQQQIEEANTNNNKILKQCSDEVDLCIETKNREATKAKQTLADRDKTIEETTSELKTTKQTLQTKEESLRKITSELGNNKMALAQKEEKLSKEIKEKIAVQSTLNTTKVEAESAAKTAAAEISAITEQKKQVEKEKEKCNKTLEKEKKIVLNLRTRLRRSADGNEKVAAIIRTIQQRALNEKRDENEEDSLDEAMFKLIFPVYLHGNLLNGNDSLKKLFRENQENSEDIKTILNPNNKYELLNELLTIVDGEQAPKIWEEDESEDDENTALKNAISMFEENIGKIAQKKDEAINRVENKRISDAEKKAEDKEALLKKQVEDEAQKLQEEAKAAVDKAAAEAKAAADKAAKAAEEEKLRVEEAQKQAIAREQESATELAELKEKLEKSQNDNRSKDQEIVKLNEQLSTLKDNKLVPVVDKYVDYFRGTMSPLFKGGRAPEVQTRASSAEAVAAKEKEEAVAAKEKEAAKQPEVKEPEGEGNQQEQQDAVEPSADVVNIAQNLGMTSEEEKAASDLENLQSELQTILQKIEEEKKANSSNDDTNSQKLIESNNKIEELEREVERLRESISSLEESKEQLTNKEQEINNLKEQLLEVKSKLQSDEANETEKRQKELEREIKHKKELQEQKDEAEKQAKLAEADKAKAQAELAEADESKAEAELAEEEARIARETEEAKKKLEKKRLNDEDNKKLYQQITACMEKKEQADKENVTNKTEINGLTAELTSLKEQNRELETKKNKAEEISGRHMNRIEEIERKLQTELENITRITKEKDELQQTITQDKEKYTQELKEQKDKFNANLLEIREIKKENAKLKSDLDLEKQQKEQLQADLDKTTEKNATLNGELLKLQKTIRDLVSNDDNVSQTINVKKKYDEIYAKIKNLLDNELIIQEDYDNKLKPILDKYYGLIDSIAKEVLSKYRPDEVQQYGGNLADFSLSADDSLSIVLSDSEKRSKSDEKFTQEVLDNIGLHQKDLTSILGELEEQRQRDTAKQIKKEHEQQLKDKKKEEDEKKNTELQKYYKDGKWDFNSLVDNHDLMEYIRNEKPNLFEDIIKYRKSKEDEALAVLDEEKKAKKRVEQEKIDAFNQRAEKTVNQLQEEINKLDDDKKKLAAENKEFAKAVKDFKKEIKELKELVRKKEEEIELIKLEKEKLENELKLCSGIKPSEDEDGIIAEFLNKFKNDVYKVEKKFLDIVNNIPKHTLENLNERKVYLQQLISELSKIKYSVEYSIKDLKLSNTTLSEKLNNRINSRIDEGIEGYRLEIDR